MTVVHRKRDFEEVVNVAFRFFAEEFSLLRWPLLITPLVLATNVVSPVAVGAPAPASQSDLNLY